MKFSNEVKVGLVVTAGIVFLIWGINYLKGTDIFSSRNTYYAVYNNVDGLKESDPVVLSGYKVGHVAGLDFVDDRSGRLLVTLMIEDRIEVPKQSIVRITTDLLGTRTIELEMSEYEAFAASGDTLVAATQPSFTAELNKQVGPIKGKAENLMVSLDSVAIMLNKLLNDENRNSLGNTFSNIEAITKKLDYQLGRDEGRLYAILDNISSITENIKDNNEQLSNILQNFSTLSDTLAKARIAETILQTNAVLKETELVFEKINNGEGSMGMLLKDEALYNNLTNSADNLDKLLIDMKEHPKRYVHFSVFGKSDKK
ncbi:MAG: MCE family protein [Bacteroidia bacterium]|nr:MCE family protein [Bacteroidia bacterium]NNC84828.1 MCE family protein [Bacteroidia bacterium]NNM16493.1 MCE family protein [Bacteroidia bacterium]